MTLESQLGKCLWLPWDALLFPLGKRFQLPQMCLLPHENNAPSPYRVVHSSAFLIFRGLSSSHPAYGHSLPSPPPLSSLFISVVFVLILRASRESAMFGFWEHSGTGLALLLHDNNALCFLNSEGGLLYGFLWKHAITHSENQIWVQVTATSQSH